MLSEFRSTNITWDKATSRIYAPITANESDENGRKLVVQVVNGGPVEDLTGSALHLYWETVDKLHEGLDVFKAVDLKKGMFELSYTTGMLSNKGVLRANLVLVNSVGRIVSDRFRITVKDGIDNDAIQSENSFTTLTQALIDISNLETKYAPRLNDLTAQLQQTNELSNTKVGNGVLAGMGDLSQEVKEAMTGGSVAVVGKGTVTAENLANDTRSLTGIKVKNLHKGSLLNGYIVDSTGKFISRSYRRATDFIPIKENLLLYTNRKTFTNPQLEIQIVVFYDANRNYLGSKTSDEDSVTPLPGSRYIRMTAVTNTETETFVPNNFLVWQEYESDLESLKNGIEMVKVGINLFNGKTVQGSVQSGDGTLTNTNDPMRKVTDFTVIESNKLIKTNYLDLLISDTVTTQTFVFYDAQKNFISSFVTGNSHVMPPVNARYVRQNLSSGTLTHFKVDENAYRIWQDEVLESEIINDINDEITQLNITVNDINDEITQLNIAVNELLTQKGFDIPKTNLIHAYDFYNSSLSDSEIIKKCIDFTRILTSRVIVFDKKDWFLDEAILLPENTIVIVDGVTIKQNNEVFDNVFRGDNLVIDESNPNHYPLSVTPIEHIYIYGINGAILEGPDVNVKMEHPSLGLQEAVGDFWGWRTFHICLSKASHFEISGFKMRKTRCWSVSFDKCSFGKVHDLNILSNVKNGDGVDVRFGCHDMEIYNISGSTSDDTVAMSNIDYFPSGNYVYPLEPSAFENDVLPLDELAIHSISVDNITTTGKHHGVICLSNSGRKVYDILISDIKEPTQSNRESVVKFYSGYGAGYVDGDLHNIRVNDVISKGATYAVQTNATVRDVWFNKIRQEKIGGDVSTFSNPTGIKITNS